MAPAGEAGPCRRRGGGSGGGGGSGSDPWQQALVGLQRGCQQLGDNLSQLGKRVQDGLAAHAARRALAPARQQQQAAIKKPSLLASLSQALPAPGAAPPASWQDVASSWGGAGAGGSALSSAAAGAAGGTVSREEVGRATWTFLHTLAAQYPEQPTRQQQRDARNLIDILTRMYPCGECAQHFKELVRASPPSVASRRDFSLWMCEAHNTVNRRLGKPTFNCALAEARWAGIECEEDEQGRQACSLEVGRRRR